MHYRLLSNESVRTIVVMFHRGNETAGERSGCRNDPSTDPDRSGSLDQAAAVVEGGRR